MDMLTSSDKELGRSIRLLDATLTRVLKTQASPGIASTVKRLKTGFAQLAVREDEALRARLVGLIEKLEPEAASEVASSTTIASKARTEVPRTFTRRTLS